MAYLVQVGLKSHWFAKVYSWCCWMTAIWTLHTCEPTRSTDDWFFDGSQFSIARQTEQWMTSAPQKPTKHEAMGRTVNLTGWWFTMDHFQLRCPIMQLVFGMQIFLNTLAGGRQVNLQHFITTMLFELLWPNRVLFCMCTAVRVSASGACEWGWCETAKMFQVHSFQMIWELPDSSRKLYPTVFLWQRHDKGLTFQVQRFLPDFLGRWLYLDAVAQREESGESLLFRNPVR